MVISRLMNFTRALPRVGRGQATGGMRGVKAKSVAQARVVDYQPNKNFASDLKSGGRVIATKFKVSELFSTCYSGAGCKSEYEVIVKGSKARRAYSYSSEEWLDAGG
jgi:hypothetical protein